MNIHHSISFILISKSFKTIHFNKRIVSEKNLKVTPLAIFYVGVTEDFKDL